MAKIPILGNLTHMQRKARGRGRQRKRQQQQNNKNFKLDFQQRWILNCVRHCWKRCHNHHWLSQSISRQLQIVENQQKCPNNSNSCKAMWIVCGICNTAMKYTVGWNIWVYLWVGWYNGADKFHRYISFITAIWKYHLFGQIMKIVKHLDSKYIEPKSRKISLHITLNSTAPTHLSRISLIQ